MAGAGLTVLPTSYAVGDVKKTAKETADRVLAVVASNCKLGPFTSTAGLSLPYYLNLSTNFLDADIAPDIVELFAAALDQWFKAKYSGVDVVCVGMEMAGGVMVGQLAALPRNHTLHQWADFVYVRKAAKSSGTRQRLEGPNRLTSRTPHSPLLKAIWVDDCLSTGSSLSTTAKELKDQYNIVVESAVFLVDRSVDRTRPPANEKPTPLPWAMDIRAVFDLDDVDEQLPETFRFRNGSVVA